MPSQAKTVADYLSSLPEDRRAALAAVRQAIRDNLDPDYEEGMQYGMIGYYVPHRVFPAGYHCDPKQPLPFAGLAAQKNHLSLHLMGVYMDPEIGAWFRDAWQATGHKLDMGAACVRFRQLADVPLDVVAEAIRRMPAVRYIAIYTGNLAGRGKSKGSAPAKKPASKTAAKKTAAKKPKPPTRTRAAAKRR